MGGNRKFRKVVRECEMFGREKSSPSEVIAVKVEEILIFAHRKKNSKGLVTSDYVVTSQFRRCWKNYPCF